MVVALHGWDDPLRCHAPDSLKGLHGWDVFLPVGIRQWVGQPGASGLEAPITDDDPADTVHQVCGSTEIEPSHPLAALHPLENGGIVRAEGIGLEWENGSRLGHAIGQ